jgi:hypothetical protein
MSIRFALITLTLVSAPLGCRPAGQDRAAEFVWPEGDADAGKQDFLDLKCHACHEVDGLDDVPRPVADPQVDVKLGGLAVREPTDGELVTSMVNPSHRLIPGGDEARITTESGESRMANLREVMTVQQLIDLVAFLHDRYQTKDEMAR